LFATMLYYQVITIDIPRTTLLYPIPKTVVPRLYVTYAFVYRVPIDWESLRRNLVAIFYLFINIDI